MEENFSDTEHISKKRHCNENIVAERRQERFIKNVSSLKKLTIILFALGLGIGINNKHFMTIENSGIRVINME
jgi:hypothetical protein